MVYPPLVNRIPLLTLVFILAFFLLCGGCDKETNTQAAERYFQAGLKSLEAEKPDDAVIQFKNAVQKNPKHAKAHLQLGKIYAQQSDTAAKIKMAARQFSEAIKSDIDLNEARKELAVLCFRNKSYKIAIPLCQELIERKADDAEVLLILGNSLAYVGKLIEAVDILQKAVNKAPDNPRAKISLALALFADNQPENARKMMESGAASVPEDVTAQLFLAQLYSKLKLFTEAETKFKLIINRFPDTIAPYHLLARFYWSQRQANDLEIFFKHLIKQFPDRAEPYRILSHNYFMRRQFDEAEAVLAQAVNDQKIKTINLYSDMARQYHQRKQFNKALQSYITAAEQFPDTRKNWAILAEYYVYLKQFEKARATLAKLYAKWPDNPQSGIYAQSRTAEIFFDEGKDEEALKITDEILAKNPQNPKVHLLQGKIRMKAGKHRQAREDFAIVREQAPDWSIGNFYHGLTLMEEKDYKTAENDIAQALAKNSNSWKIRQTIAEIYLRNNKPEQALDEINMVLAMQAEAAQKGDKNSRKLKPSIREQLNDENLRARMLRAAIYVGLKKFEAAASDYEIVLQAKPESPRTQFRLAEIYYALGKADKAIKGFEAVKTSYPDPIKPFEKIIKIYKDKKEYSKALALCDAGMQKYPGNLQIGLLKALLLVKLKKYDASLKLLETLSNQNLQSDRPFMAMAAIYKIKKDVAASMDMFQKAIVINPENKAAYMHKASIYKKQGETDKAIATYEALLKAVKTYPPAENDLAYLYAEADRNLDRALHLALRAKKKVPNAPEIADTVGYVYLKRNSAVQASKYLREAMDGNPDHPYVHYHWGMLQQQEKKYHLAKEAYNKALALGVGPDTIEDIKKRIDELEAPLKAWPDVKRKILKALEDKKLDEAMAAAQKNYKQMPAHPDVADVLGWIYLKKGSVIQAKSVLRKAIDGDPQNPLYHFHIGAAFYEQRDFHEARKALQLALDLGLNEDDALTSRKLLNVMGIY
ncbi:tetratricopeptide repeat protein [Desulfococcaceae bacterium HSG9]|nr:tetratricopeptide repeat protein [Desulfococcaceae bacterium HSG9]